MVDANGKEVPGPETYGLAVEMSGEKYYFREPPEFCDDEMREVMAATVLENQVGAVLTSPGCLYLSVPRYSWNTKNSFTSFLAVL